jgi:hypothetical protein
MSSELSNEQHADRGLQEEVRGVLAGNTGTNRQLEAKREGSQFGREATNVGETIQGGSSRSDHWSSSKSSNLRELTSHAYNFQLLSLTRRFGKKMLITRKPPLSLETRPLLRLQRGQSILVKLELCSPLLKGREWARNSPAGRITEPSIPQQPSQLGPTRRADLKSPKMGHCSDQSRRAALGSRLGASLAVHDLLARPEP